MQLLDELSRIQPALATALVALGCTSLAGALVIGMAGWLGVRRTISQPPNVILKEL